jgi:predicted small lipoprotein YifL
MKPTSNMNSIATMALVLSLTGCGGPQFPPPARCVDARHGGYHNDNRQTATTEFLMRVSAQFGLAVTGVVVALGAGIYSVTSIRCPTRGASWL